MERPISLSAQFNYINGLIKTGLTSEEAVILADKWVGRDMTEERLKRVPEILKKLQMLEAENDEEMK